MVRLGSSHEVGGRSAPGLDDDASVILQYGFEGLRYTISPTREYVACQRVVGTPLPVSASYVPACLEAYLLECIP